MKRISLLILSCLVLSSLFSQATAVDKVRVKQITLGEVAAVDATANSLTVRGKKAEVVITTDERTEIKKGSIRSSLADLQIGDKVTVKYLETDGRSIARVIDIKSAKAEKTSVKSNEPIKSQKK
jgi:hypothetical protein